MSGRVSTTNAGAIAAIRAGDVIYARSSSGQQKLLLVYEVDQKKILTRHVPTQERIAFGPDGISRPSGKKEKCRIVSTAPLSRNEYEITLGLDRKMRTARKLDDLRLSKQEIRLLLDVHNYFEAHPLPSDDPA
jgi:hypothetical protein